PAPPVPNRCGAGLLTGEIRDGGLLPHLAGPEERAVQHAAILEVEDAASLQASTHTARVQVAEPFALVVPLAADLQATIGRRAVTARNQRDACLGAVTETALVDPLDPDRDDVGGRRRHGEEGV